MFKLPAPSALMISVVTPCVSMFTAVATPAASAPAYLVARPRGPLNATYPVRALSERLSGYVILEFTVDDKGRAADISVVESSPPRVFDESATQAVRRGRFDTDGTLPAGAPRRARLRVGFRP